MADYMSRLYDLFEAARKAADWREGVRVCREGVAATEDAAYRDWAYFRFQLANCLQRLGDPASQEEAISLFRDVLARTPRDDLDHVGRANVALGFVYEHRATGPPQESCSAAMGYYGTALRYMDRAADPLGWASVATRFGLVTGRLAALTRLPHEALEEAAARLREAMEVFDSHQCPEESREASAALETLAANSHRRASGDEV